MPWPHVQVFSGYAFTLRSPPCQRSLGGVGRKPHNYAATANGIPATAAGEAHQPAPGLWLHFAPPINRSIINRQLTSLCSRQHHRHHCPSPTGNHGADRGRPLPSQRCRSPRPLPRHDLRRRRSPLRRREELARKDKRRPVDHLHQARRHRRHLWYARLYLAILGSNSCSPVLACCFVSCHADPPSPAAVGGVFEFTRAASANLREKDDFWNHATGGFLAGAVLGVRSTGISSRGTL